MKSKGQKVVLKGWANCNWQYAFRFRFPSLLLTKQTVGVLAFPYITNPRTKKIDGRSHAKRKVRITIEEI